jgi:hypothetical protein
MCADVRPFPKARRRLTARKLHLCQIFGIRLDLGWSALAHQPNVRLPEQGQQ